MPERRFYVYLMASRTRVLYCGMTSSLQRRVQQHKDGTFEGFSKTYRCTRLVWFQAFQYFDQAILREKQIKRWRREKKLAIIQQKNAAWHDLSELWLNPKSSENPQS
jgi:putative endonuclease